MANFSLNSYTYLALSDSDIIPYRTQILDLLALYYENPKDVFEMIYPDRVFFTAFYENNLIGIYTVKHKNMNNHTILVYLGLLVLHFDHGRILKNLVLAHTEDLKKIIGKTIYIYCLTSNPQVHKIASKFYQNIYPRFLNEKETHIPGFYKDIISHTGYDVCYYNSYKVIRSPSVARYNKYFLNKLINSTALSGNDFSKIYDLDMERGDRLLIIGCYNN